MTNIYLKNLLKEKCFFLSLSPSQTKQIYEINFVKK